MRRVMEEVDEYDEDEEDDCIVTSMKRGSGSGQGGSKSAPKKPRHMGPMNKYFARKPQGVKGAGRQQTMNEVCKKELRNNACKEIARWFYDAGLPFNAATYDSFHIAMEAVAQFGPGFKPPSMYELRVPLLKKEVEDTEDNIKNYKNEWTPCASHCIDLMLEDIGNLERVKSCLKKAMFMNGYKITIWMYVNMMRRFTNQRNLHRPAITRFATSFITLAQLHKQRNNLQRMITSDNWVNSKWSKETAGKEMVRTILSDGFWRNVAYALKLTGPLVKVLRIVDGDKKPAMGYIYEAMDRLKETKHVLLQ
ncbi:retrovirus-related pol polyprotein from transposon RE1 [Tanacetum coccineum]